MAYGIVLQMADGKGTAERFGGSRLVGSASLAPSTTSCAPFLDAADVILARLQHPWTCTSSKSILERRVRLVRRLGACSATSNALARNEAGRRNPKDVERVLDKCDMLTSMAFEKAAKAFQQHWERYRRGEETWEWMPLPRKSMFKTSGSDGQGVLRMRRVEPWSPDEREEAEEREETNEESWVELQEEPMDEATAVLQRSHDDRPPRIWEFCIAYNEVYRVPCLLMDPRKEGKLLGVHEALHFVPDQCKGQISILGITGNVTMEEHPITGVPCYALHPCQTADALSVVLGLKNEGKSNAPEDMCQKQQHVYFELEEHADASELLKYMVAFYSIVQDIVGVPLTANLAGYSRLQQ